MNRTLPSAIAFVPVLLLAACLTALAADAADLQPSYLSGGGYWRQRVRVTVENQTEVALEGRPVAVGVGTAAGEAQLAGTRAESVRVLNSQGVDVLYGLSGPDGSAIDEGPIPAGSTLVLPVDCPTGGSADYSVCFDNPDAWAVPDSLSTRIGLVNGDVELGEGAAPSGWRHDAADAEHEATWSSEGPKSGKRCLKTIVAAGAEPTWIATRQHGISILGGAKYVMRAWVKADGVKGNAGWYIHVGNAKDAMLSNAMLNGGEGTYDWKEVTATFTAPAEADWADLGTVLRGSGTAWFDDVRLECLTPGKIQAKAGAPERIELKEIGPGEAWYEPAAGEGPRSDRRLVVRAYNFEDHPTGPTLISVDALMLKHRLGGHLDRSSIRVIGRDGPVAFLEMGDTLLVKSELPPHSVATYHVYYSPLPLAGEGQGVGAESDSPDYSSLPAVAQGQKVKPDANEDDSLSSAAKHNYVALVASSYNLVKNPSFETGEKSPADWSGVMLPSKESGIAVVPDEASTSGIGRRCAKVYVPHDAKSNWRGWRQTVPVRPGRSYLFAAWVRCEELHGSELRLHAHCHKADGSLCEDNPMRSTGGSIEGTTDWTLLSGAFTMPADAASFSLHLTMNSTGTAWYDGVLVAETDPGMVARLEGRPLAAAAPVAVWPVNAVVKLFPDEPAPASPADVQIALAGNEQESLQLGVRSGKAYKDVRIEVDPPVGPGGAKLADFEVNVVGYVPIDHATAYFSKPDELPTWYRKFPDRSGMCDGFPGSWPDPLLPQDRFDLAANQTQAVWVTYSTPKDAAPGDYRGRLRLVAERKTLAEVAVSVKVWGFTLPDQRHVKAIYDARLGHNPEVWGAGGMSDFYPQAVRFMARRRLCPDEVYPMPVFKQKDGKVTVDFTEFDKAAAWYFDELHLPHSYTPWHLYLFGWGHPPKKIFGQQPYEGEYPFADADRSCLRPEYKEVYQECLRLFWNHVKEKGWHERFVLYISDEPFFREEPILQQMKALCKMIHEVDPAIPIYSSTWHHVPEWDDSLDIWGIGHYGVVPVEEMEKIRAAGRKIWFTTDGQMCTDTPYCAVERLLPHYCFKYGAEAYEFWGVAWTTYDPYRFGWHAYIHQSSTPGKSYWVRYPNGDGFLMYPGKPIGHDGPVSSIRLEQAREGVEDYEYLYLLRHRIGQAKAAGRDTSAAQAALEGAAELVTIPNAGGRYSSKILPNPEAVFQVRRRVARAIEALGAAKPVESPASRD